MGDPTSTPQVESVAVPRFRDAYQRLHEDIRGVQDTDLVPINIDIPSAVTTALGCLPEIRALRTQIIHDMPSFDLTQFDRLEDCTLALGHAHTLYLAASAPTVALNEIAGSALKMRELLFSDVSALAQRGYIDSGRLKSLKGVNGYRNLAFDLFTLGALIRENWPSVNGKSAVQMDEIDRAETLADQLLTAVGHKEQAPTFVAETSDTRSRAFALFLRAYDDVRRVVNFLRWHYGDSDDIAPSLYAGRTSGKRKPEDPEPLPTVPPITPPTVAPTVPGTNGGPQAAPGTVGLPTSDPFARP